MSCHRRRSVSRFAFTYFGTEVEVLLAPDGKGGTDLTLTNRNVPDEEYEQLLPGWLNLLLPLKAAADFAVDLRNHDPTAAGGNSMWTSELTKREQE